jgi:cleavage and polyadenylation specificity factor subunit 2
MSASTQFTPLCGEEGREACCFLLEIDECRILLDCGWDWSMAEHLASTPLLDSLKKIAPDIDCVLISHPDLDHIGALPLAVAKLGLNCPIYATLPVFRIGKLVLYDALQDLNSRTTM